jgi:hypothetical protein
MNDPETNPPGMNQTFCPCPFCGSTDLIDGSWYIDDEEVDAVECNACKAGAPTRVWNERPSPWRRAPVYPLDGQRVLITYEQEDGSESREVIRTWIDGEQGLLPLVRWMPVPEVRSHE